jgi:DNA-binding transcriptional regulator WhiA
LLDFKAGLFGEDFLRGYNYDLNRFSEGIKKLADVRIKNPDGTLSGIKGFEEAIAGKIRGNSPGIYVEIEATLNAIKKGHKPISLDEKIILKNPVDKSLTVDADFLSNFEGVSHLFQSKSVFKFNKDNEFIARRIASWVSESPSTRKGVIVVLDQRSVDSTMITFLQSLGIELLDINNKVVR